MDRLESMSMVVAVAEAGSLSAAARKLGKPIPTVSRRVSELEARLKTQLFHRSSRQMTLTDAGRSYIEACKRIIGEIEDAEREVVGEYSAPKGELTATAPWGLGHMHLLPIACEFLAAYPEIALRLLLTDEVVKPSEHNVDVAIRIGALPDSSLIARRIGSVTFVVCASPAYLAVRGEPETPRDLRGHDCITVEDGGGPRRWRFVEAGREFAEPVLSRLTVNTSEAAVEAAVAGVGIARVMSYKMAAARSRGELVALLEPFCLEPWPVHLVYPNRQPLPLKLRVFIDWITPRLKARLYENASL